MNIRRFKSEDAAETAALVRKTISISNINDYPKELMDELTASFTSESVIQRSSWTHFYVAEDNGSIIGCGAIGPYWGSVTESSLFTIFVLPEYQRRGIGRQIIDALEADEFFLRAKRVEVPASVTAVRFYQKMGYTFKNGIAQPDNEHVVRMEKLR